MRLDPKARAALPDRAFAYVDPSGRRLLPIHDPAHVRNALARFGTSSFDDDAAREQARRRLLNAAKRYKIVPIGFISGQLRSERSLGRDDDRPVDAPGRLRHDGDDRHRGLDRARPRARSAATAS